MSADEFDPIAADDGMETREKGERAVSVSVEAVEKAADALRDYWAEAYRAGTGAIPENEARAALVAALPVIERDLRADERERCAKEIEAMKKREQSPAFNGAMSFAAARVREGGRA